jgi:hypothetical protein
MNDRARDKPVAVAAPSGARQLSVGVNETPILAPSEREQALAAGQGVLMLQAASGAADPPPRFPLSPTTFMALQRTVGNRAIAAAMERLVRVQRVPVTVNFNETLYNTTDKGGKATAGHFGQGGQYQMTRDADTAVNVEIKIKFLRQARNTADPRPGHPSDPKVGDLTGQPTELPAGDRPWATSTAAAAVAHWAGQLVLVGVDKPRPDAADVNKRLPVNFKATPVFGKDDAADQTVIVHPPGVIGGSKGNPIDSGNYYMKKDNSAYPDSDDKIYAHEYGHLLGIPDEYSQSSEQMNLLLHRASPATAASSAAALDKKTVELMVLATLTGPLVGRLHRMMGPVNNAIRGQRKAVKAKMTIAAHDAVRTPEVADMLKNRLTTMSEARLAPKIPKAVALQTTTNFAQAKVATEGVDDILSPEGVSQIIESVYRGALETPQDEAVAVPSFGDVKIEVSDSIKNAAFKKGALQTAAKGEVGEVVGKPGLPKLPPPTTLAGQLAAVPATWGGAGGAIETGITPAKLQAKLLAGIEAATVAAVAPPPPGVTAKPSIKSSKALFAKAWVLINNAARSSVKQLAAELVVDTMDPVLESSVATLRTAIAGEVNRVMSSPPGALATAPPDPNMAKIVADMKGRLDAAKTALSGTGMDPLGVPGAKTPAQDVTYSYQGLMGSGDTTVLRNDQFQPMADKFNSTLKLPTEQPFKPEAKAP